MVRRHATRCGMATNRVGEKPPPTPIPEDRALPPARRLLRLLTTPGTGQVRSALQEGTYRSWTDPQILSHIAFVPAIAIAAARAPPLPELAALQACVLCLSLAYHRNFERPGLLAKGEGTSAKLLFLYGTTQTFQSPDPTFLLANSACFCLTLAAFVGTGRRA